jgi:hypothetical protein
MFREKGIEAEREREREREGGIENVTCTHLRK